ncbi:MAG TPA: hypothetical protein VJA17_02655 [Candidatus Omnitrophota bacterium]|nr:hypothetical protein [Candidatus Omnitrophota bacterium]
MRRFDFFVVSTYPRETLSLPLLKLEKIEKIGQQYNHLIHIQL